MPAHTLAEAEIYAVVTIAIDGRVIADAGENRLARGTECGRQRPGQDYVSAGVRSGGNFLVDIDGLVLMQTENMGVFRFEDRVVVHSPAVADVKLFGYRVAIVGVDDAANAAVRQSCGWAGKGRKRTLAVLPLSEGQASPGNYIRGSRQAQYGLEDGGVGLLFHEQWNVLERVAEVETKAATQNVLPGSGDVVRKADAGAEVLCVVMRQVPNEVIRILLRRRISGDRDQCLIGATLGDVRLAESIEVAIPAKAEIQRQPVVHLPIVLAIEAKLLGGDQEVRIAV